MQACIFDVGNVLMKASPSWTAALEAETGIPNAERRRHSIEVETQMEGRPFVGADMIPLFASRLGHLDRAAADAMGARMASVFTDPGALEPIQPMWDLVAELSGAGVQVGVLSNGPGDAAAIARVLGSLDVRASVISGRDGVGKPRSEAFELVLARLGVPAADAWFVDDHPAHVEAARSCGVHGFVFDGDVPKLIAELRSSGLSW